MTRRVCIFVAAALLLSACGGGSEEPATSEPTPTTAPSEPEPEPTAIAIDGTPVPEALSRFRCEPRDSGWVAVGYVSNDTDDAASFQVTVSVGSGEGDDQGKTRRLENVEAGGSVEFVIRRIPSDGERCHVQVLRLP